MQSFATNPAMKSHMETQLGFLTELSNKLCDSARKISDLNVQLAQQIIEDCIGTGRQMVSAHDPVEFTTTAMSYVQPVAERWRHYQQQLLGVLAGTQVELTKTAETHIPEASRTAAAMADELVRKASEETEKASERQRSAMERINRPTPRASNGAQQGAS
ncbi:MAG: TIGR01841 family phasin [Pseudomonadota bacterium]